MKIPKDDARYSWTHHVFEKMQYYGLSESRIKRIIRYPKRTEEGIAPDTVAVMQKSDGKHPQELWVMYRLEKKQETINKKLGTEETPFKKWQPNNARIKIITAWRYPGESPERDPVPQEILREVQQLL
ncbi:MAG: hypothetical protein AAB631_00805 [Patescibacteria group bacterium]